MEAVVLLVAIPLSLFWAAAAQDRRRRGRFAEIARAIGGGGDDTGAYGFAYGVPVTYRLTVRSTSARSEAWTEADADVPRAYPLSIHVRRHRGADDAQIARGAMVHVPMGDPYFDRAFLAEVAPVDVARLLLDHEVRSYLASHATVELDTVDVGPRRVLRLALRGCFDEPPEAFAAIAAAAKIAVRVRFAFEAVQAGAPLRDAGTPYRPMLDESLSRDADDARAREVARLDELRRDRAIKS